MKLKTLILWGYILMGAVILVLSLFSIYFIESLNKASQTILKDNYLSIESANKMIDNLDIIDNSQVILSSDSYRDKTVFHNEYKESKSIFEKSLSISEGNITETGEREVLQNLRKEYQSYISKIESADSSGSGNRYTMELLPSYKKVKQLCYELLSLNEKAMLRKNDEVKNISRDTEIYMLILTAVSLLLVLAIILKAPGTIIQPIYELTKKVGAISEKKYSERIEVKSENEVGMLALSFNKMAEKLSEYEKSNVEKLIAEKKRAEAIVDNMRDAIIVLDENNDLILMNNVGSELLGLSGKEVIGKSASSIADSNNLFKNIFEEKDKLQDVFSGENKNYLRIINKDKEEFYLRDYTDVLDANGNRIGVIIVLKNVTGFKELDEIKSGFVATVSHELKTPLAAINMSLRLLNDSRIGELNAEQKKLTEEMKNEIRRLLKMVNELLNLSKIESGGEAYNYQFISVDELIDASVTPMLMQFEQNKVEFNFKIEKNLPKLKIDVNKIAWVIINLLNNAVRYTKTEGKITLSVSRENEFIKFSLKDNGIGIKPEHIGRIFQKFVQLNKSNMENQYKGVGLGLAIAKEFIEAHKGTIKVISEYNKGSEFIFYLPVFE
ncbi:MAG: PAS domain S-box protein [Ignavibacteria bacterium]|nr:PAS domain S-box protein [Ignavibacteria bacterium]